MDFGTFFVGCFCPSFQSRSETGSLTCTGCDGLAHGVHSASGSQDPAGKKTQRLLILSCAYMGACCVLAQRWGDLVTGSLLTRTKVRTGSIRPRASAALVLPLNPSVVWPNECLYWAACPALSGMDTVRRLVCTYRLTAPQPVRVADPYNFGGAFLCSGAAQSAASNSA